MKNEWADEGKNEIFTEDKMGICPATDYDQCFPRSYMFSMEVNLVQTCGASLCTAEVIFNFVRLLVKFVFIQNEQIVKSSS